MQGPLIKDEVFFSSLDSNIPEMRKASELYFAGDRDSATKVFADYVKNNLDTERILKAYSISVDAVPSEAVMKEANAALEYNLFSVGIYHKFEKGKVDWYSNPTENGYEEWTWQFARHYQLLSIALAYNYTKDERYAILLEDLIHGFIKQAVRPDLEVDGHATLCWRTLDAGIRLVHWGKIFALTIKSPSYSDEFILDVFKSMLEHGERLMLRCTDANWLITEMHGLYISSLSYGFLKDAALWNKFAKDKLLTAIRSQSLPDGTHCELSFGYQSVSCSDFANTYRVGKNFGDNFTSEYLDLIKGYMYTFVKVMAPDNTTPNLNDGYLEKVREFTARNIDLFPDDEMLLWVASGGKDGKEPNFKSLLFENAGITVMRSGWEKDAVFGIFDGGKYGKCHNHEDLIRCHQHEDKLNFLMWVGKDNVVCESMNYAYDTSKMRAYSRASVGHNVALVNGLGQNRFVNASWDDDFARSVEPTTFSSSSKIDITSAVYNEGFGDNCERLAVHKRTVAFIKKPHIGKPFFIIKDEILAEKEEDVTLIWHYNTKDLKLTDNGCHCSELTTLFVGDGSTRMYFGSEEPFAGWRTVSVKPPIYVPTPVVHFSARGQSLTVFTLFIPNDEDGKCPVISAELEKQKITVSYSDGVTIDYNI